MISALLADPAKYAWTTADWHPSGAYAGRELLPEVAGGHALEADDETGDRLGGREVRQQVGVVGFAVELAQYLATKTKVGIQNEDTMPA